MDTIGTVIISEYSRTDSGKSWKSKPDEVVTESVTMDNVIKATADDTLSFFRRLGGYEGLEKSYTSRGYLPWKLTSISPDRSIKRVREYTYNPL